MHEPIVSRETLRRDMRSKICCGAQEGCITANLLVHLLRGTRSNPGVRNLGPALWLNLNIPNEQEVRRCWGVIHFFAR